MFYKGHIEYHSSKCIYFVHKCIHNILTVCAQNFFTDGGVQSKKFGDCCPRGPLCDHRTAQNPQARHTKTCSFHFRSLYSNSNSNWVGLLTNRSGLFYPLPKGIVPRPSEYNPY